MIRQPEDCKPQLAEIERRVTYIGSPEHKAHFSALLDYKARPSPRPDASICPENINKRSVVLKWLKEALRKGAVSERWEGDFPCYVWFYHKQRDEYFIGRLSNKVQGIYKGFPVTEKECPRGLKKRYE